MIRFKLYLFFYSNAICTYVWIYKEGSESWSTAFLPVCIPKGVRKPPQISHLCKFWKPCLLREVFGSFRPPRNLVPALLFSGIQKPRKSKLETAVSCPAFAANRSHVAKRWIMGPALHILFNGFGKNFLTFFPPPLPFPLLTNVFSLPPNPKYL